MRYVVEIPNPYAEFGLSVLKALSFVKKTMPLSLYENKVINDLEVSVKEVKLHRQGKKELKTARELLDEL